MSQLRQSLDHLGGVRACRGHQYVQRKGSVRYVQNSAAVLMVRRAAWETHCILDVVTKAREVFGFGPCSDHDVSIITMCIILDI